MPSSSLFKFLDDYLFGPFNLGMLFSRPPTNGDDVINGSIWSDTIKAKGGNDTVRAGNGDDKVYGEDGNDTLYGERGNDLLDGGKGNDNLSGGDGKDTMIGGKDNDVLDGGTGVDLAKYSGAKMSYDIDLLGDGTIRITDLVANRDGVDILDHIENVQFGNGPVESLLQLALPTLTFTVDGAVPTQYLVGGNFLPYGSQSTGPNGWTMTLSDEGQIVGLATRYRTVNDPEDPVSSVLEYGGRMIHNTFQLNDGPQDVINGSNSNNAARASGNTDYFWGDDDTALVDLLAQGYQVKLSFTSTTGVDVHAHAVVNTASPSDIAWALDSSPLVNIISDDGGNPAAPFSSTFNSQNIAAFYDPLDNFGPRTEEVIIAVYDANDVLIQGVHHTIQYGDFV